MICLVFVSNLGNKNKRRQSNLYHSKWSIQFIKVLHLSNQNDSMFYIVKTALKSMWKNVNTISLFSFTRVFVLENSVLAKWKCDSLSCYDLHSISSKEITCWNIIFLEICFGYKRKIVGRNKSLTSNNASNTHKKFWIFTSTY